MKKPILFISLMSYTIPSVPSVPAMNKSQEPKSPIKIEIFRHFTAGGMTFLEPVTPRSNPSPETTPLQTPHPATSPRRLLKDAKASIPKHGAILRAPKHTRRHSAPIDKFQSAASTTTAAAAATSVCKKQNEELQKKSNS